MTRYAVSPDATCAVVEDGAVVLHMRTKRYYSLNETGATIWRLLEEDLPIEDIASQLVLLYDVERATANSAVARLLDELLAESLVSTNIA
ncbi:MAG: PqqD family protein [Anaerolineae bacterium]|nr:PqqD family protein [Gemmatimonadaceae bacterium]